MSQSPLPLDTAATATAAGDFAHLPLERVWADPDQPRRTFDEPFLAQLSESIKTQGVIQPIVVRPTSASEVTYTIISGESRWRASQMAGKDTIPALIRRDLSEGDIAVMQILENLQRRDLTLIETCEGVTRLVKEIGLDKAAEQLGMSKSWVSRHSTLAELPPEVLDLVKVGKVESVEIAKDLGELVKIDAKKGGVLVGRIAGTHTRYGDAVATHSFFTEPASEDPEATAEDIADERAESERLMMPPNRIEIRDALRLARSQAEEKQRIQAQRAAAQGDPKAQAEKEKARKAVEAEKARKQRIAEFNHTQAVFAVEQTNKLCEVLGLRAPKPSAFGYAHDAVAQVVGERLSEYGGKAAPKSVEAGDFQLVFRQPPDAVVQRLQRAGFTLELNVQISYGALQGLSIEKAAALRELLGEKAVGISTQIECKGSEVAGFIARIERGGQKETPEAKPKAKPADGRRTMTSIEQFLYSDAVATKEGARIKASDLHAAYSRWCKKNKLTPISLRDNAFGSAITAEGYESKRSNGIVYLDIEVKA